MTANETKAELLAHLQTAAEIELSTIPPYLTALLSIKRTSNRRAAENIRSVMTEEMLHLALVANVMSSLGGAVRLARRRVATYPLQLTFKGKMFADRRFDVHLAAFSAETIKTFMAIEQPRRPQFKAMKVGLDAIVVPEPTIGEFYDRIIELLVELDGLLGRDLFNRDRRAQITEDYYWSAGGKPIVVTDLASAKAALRIVIRQGEGASDSLDDGDKPNFGQPFDIAHYFRFKEIDCARQYAPNDLPSQDPTGEPIPVDYARVLPILTDAKSSDYKEGTPLAVMNDAFNRQYSLMLIQIEEALNGNPKSLYTAIMNGMHNLSSLALEMMSTPVEADAQGRNGSPSFEWVEEI